MPLTTATQVMEAGGLNDVDAHRLFRLDSEAELRTYIESKMPLATAWLRSRAATYYASTDPDVIALFTYAEALLTLHWCLLPLKARKVMGTHWPLEMEGSERFQELIDNEIISQVEELLSPYLVVVVTGKNFALPTFRSGNALVPSDYDPADVELRQILDQANSTIGAAP